MKRAFTAFAAFLMFFTCIAQINTSSINFDGLERTFVTYVPDAYETSTPTPLVIGLHGLGGSQNDFLATGMTFVADTDVARANPYNVYKLDRLPVHGHCTCNPRSTTQKRTMFLSLIIRTLRPPLAAPS